MQSPTPEVEPLPELVLAPLLGDPKFLALVLGLLSVVAAFYLTRSNSKSSSRTRTKNVVLVGPSESGKTSIFASLAYHQAPPTHTSLIPSTSPFGALALVDLPGHPRLADFAQAYLKDARGVVFVVDSGAVVRHGPAIAQALAPVLTALASTHPAERKLLILAHKADLARGQTQALDRVRTVLSREMDGLKAARGASGGRIEGIAKVQTRKRWWAAASPEEPQDVDEGLVWGGVGGFKWEDVEGVEISWAASALGEENGLESLKEWIEALE